MRKISAISAIRKLAKQIFTTRELALASGKSLSAAAQSLDNLSKEGVVFKICRGVWTQEDAGALSPYAAIPYLFPNHRAYVSFISALHLHGIIEQIPQVTTLASTAHARVIRTNIGVYHVHRITPLFFTGFVWYKGSGSFLIAEPEKALVDSLYLSAYKKKRFGRFPELHFPASFSFKKVREWAGKIPSPKARVYVNKKLKDILLILVLALAIPATCLFCEEVQLQNVRSLSLKDAINIAFLNNKTIQIQEEQVEYAKADILDARSKFLPVIGVGFDYTLNDSVFYSESLPGRRKDTRIYSGYKNDNLFNVTLVENIFNGGADIAGYRQARLGLKVQQETLRARKLDVEFEAKRLYYGLLLAYETERIAKELLFQSKAHYDNVKNKYDQGTSSKFDVLQSSVQVSKIEPEVVRSGNAVEIITADLKKLLFLKLSEEIKVTEHLGYSPIPIKEDEYLKEAYAGSPQMVLKLLGIDINKWAIEYAKSGWYPQVTAAAGYSYRSNDVSDMFNPRHDNWNIGIQTSVAIFDGFSTKAKVDEAKAKYAQTIYEKEDYVEQLAVDVKKACLDLKEAAAIIKSQEDSIVEAGEALRISEVGYDNGVVDNLNVLDSQVSLSTVEKNLAQAIYDYLMAKAQIDRLRGIFYTEGRT
ncbi:MAG: TolC family protein [Candidatus Omnitrophota bacterium]